MKYKFYAYNGNNSSLIKKCLLDRGIWEEIQTDEEQQFLKQTNCIWRSINFSVRQHAIIEEQHRKSNNRQIINHFENTRGMTTKTGIIRSLKQYYQQNEQARQAQYSCFDSTATTYIITAGQDNIEMVSFVQRFNQMQRKFYSKEAVPMKHCQDNMWLLKPANFNQGRGIEIFKNLKEILTFLNTRKPNSLWVAQKYIEKPFLFKQRKFDIRVWVLVTQEGEVFFHNYPYLRTSSAKYDTNAQDNYVHLTNNCLQQKGTLYGQHEDGNTLPIDELFIYIKQMYPDSKIDIADFIMQKMKDLIIDTYNAVKEQMLNSKRDYCYELFGYDFLVDEDLRVWLIETNLNPYLGVPNNYIAEILPKMINSMFQIVLDPIFPPSENYQKVESQFDLIYCDNNSIYNNSKPINKRSPFNSSLYPLEELKQIPNSKLQQDQKRAQLLQSKLQIQTPNFQSLKKQQNKLPQKIQISNTNQQQPETFNKKNFNKTDSFQKTKSQKFSLPSINSGNSNQNFSTISQKCEVSTSTNVSKSYDQQSFRQNKNKIQLSSTQSQQSFNDDSSEEESYRLTLSQKHKLNMSENKIAKQPKIKIKNNIPLALEQINERQGLQMKDVFHKVRNLIKNYPYQDYEPLQNYVQNCLTKLINWELYDENEIEYTLKTIQIVMDSRFIGVFSEQKNVDTLIQIIDSQNFLLKIQLIAIKLIKYICKNASLKLFVLGKDITKSLLKIALSTVDPGEKDKYDQQLRLEAIRSLITLGGIYDRKAFIPGETRQNDDARSSLIENGGVLALIQIKNNTDEEQIMKEIKRFFLNLDLKDYDQQLKIINQWTEKFQKLKKCGENSEMIVNMLQAGTQEVELDKGEKEMYTINLKTAQEMVDNIIQKRKNWIQQWEEKQKLKDHIEQEELRKKDKQKTKQKEEKQRKLEEYQKRKLKEFQLKNELEKQKEQKRLLETQKEIEYKQQKIEEILKKKEDQIKNKKQNNDLKGFIQEKNIIEEQLIQLKYKQQQINNEIQKQNIDSDLKQNDQNANTKNSQNSQQKLNCVQNQENLSQKEEQNQTNQNIIDKIQAKMNYKNLQIIKQDHTQQKRDKQICINNNSNLTPIDYNILQSYKKSPKQINNKNKMKKNNMYNSILTNHSVALPKLNESQSSNQRYQSYNQKSIFDNSINPYDMMIQNRKYREEQFSKAYTPNNQIKNSKKLKKNRSNIKIKQICDVYSPDPQYLSNNNISNSNIY